MTKATLSHAGKDKEVIEFDEHSRIRFDFEDENTKFIEVGIGKSYNGNPCLDIRSGWTGLSIEPNVSNAIKVRLTEG